MIKVKQLPGEQIDKNEIERCLECPVCLVVCKPPVQVIHFTYDILLSGYYSLYSNHFSCGNVQRAT